MTKPNLSLNGIPGTLWEIRKQEKIHPYLGLRQAILIINSQERALKEGRLSQKKCLLKLKKQKESLATTFDADERDILLSEIDLTEHELTSFVQLFFDAEMELETAIAEKLRIESLNPDMVNSTSEDLQKQYASDAFQCKLARAVIISVYSNRKAVSEGVAEIMYDSFCLSESDKQRFDTNIDRQSRHWGLGLIAPEFTVNYQILDVTKDDCDGISVR